MVVAFFYNLGMVAPVFFCLVSENAVFQGLRTKTIILARNAGNVSQVVVTVLIMYQLNAEKWNWGAKSGFSGEDLSGHFSLGCCRFTRNRWQDFIEINENCLDLVFQQESFQVD
ncbi:AKR_HP2_G0033200.mRNA.1.CDS.1 [Saccharomyces cerevisiae]|nr:AKR_HP2_G0033200.mRNA.1.CDS.1 [Saccharomyces cerevisiae]CAI6696594.1 AKR_HP2_G0033200.mRNA.1.CDS.1 [Saccharomyces cerevisiae]